MAEPLKHALLAHHWQPVDGALRNPSVTNISIYRHDRVIAEHSNGAREELRGWISATALLDALNHLALTVDRPLNESTPIMDASWPEAIEWPSGARINCSVPPLSRWPQATIRVPRNVVTSLDLLAGRMVPHGAMLTLRHILEHRLNFVIAGLPGSGKTYLLRAMLSECTSDRFYIIEDASELQIDAELKIEHCLGNSAVQVAASDSIRAALRTRVDRIILGELRDPAAVFNWLEAAEAGFRGCAATLHAKPGEGVIHRMVGLIRRGSDLDPPAARELVLANIETVIHVDAVPGLGPRVVRIDAIEEGGALTPLWRWTKGELRPAPAALERFLQPRDKY
jgi:pilus assembly protein CpaF